MNEMIMKDKGLQDLFEHEHNIWLRKLELIQMDIVMLKNHIAVILQNEINQDTLEKVESFQSSFLNNDMIIALLRRDVRQLNEYMHYHKISESENTCKIMCNKQEALRRDISKMETELLRIKTEFKNLQIV
jgi:hypothetical protein